MPCIRHLLRIVAGLATLAAALPAQPKLSERSLKLYELAKRQNALAEAQNLTDLDILQFALTAENLESAFYTQGFATFSEADFIAAGLSSEDITNLQAVAETEAVHVTTLSSAIVAVGAVAVQPCEYDFHFTTAEDMLLTAFVLENVGVSAYLGAAPLISSSAILGVAASIVTVEARHQTFIRIVENFAAIPSAFDTALGPSSVFTLLAQFITSCPSGSNLDIQPFTALTALSGTTGGSAGGSLSLSTTAEGATACAFTNGGLTGGSAFTAFTDNSCAIPSGLSGVAYVSLTNSIPSDSVLTDEITVAGPVVFIAS